MAEIDNEAETEEVEETVVVGLVKRVFSVETRLEQPTSMEGPDQQEIQPLKKVEIGRAHV